MIFEWIDLPHPFSLHLASNGQEDKEEDLWKDRLWVAFGGGEVMGRERGAKIHPFKNHSLKHLNSVHCSYPIKWPGKFNWQFVSCPIIENMKDH